MPQGWKLTVTVPQQHDLPVETAVAIVGDRPTAVSNDGGGTKYIFVLANEQPARLAAEQLEALAVGAFCFVESYLWETAPRQ